MHTETIKKIQLGSKTSKIIPYLWFLYSWDICFLPYLILCNYCKLLLYFPSSNFRTFVSVGVSQSSPEPRLNIPVVIGLCLYDSLDTLHIFIVATCRRLYARMPQIHNIFFSDFEQIKCSDVHVIF